MSHTASLITLLAAANMKNKCNPRLLPVKKETFPLERHRLYNKLLSGRAKAYLVYSFNTVLANRSQASNEFQQ
ncbi:MAG: hypothetical protein COA75_09050 [Cellvibrionales bacterium]|nr:MAG: hypothetical protein COA75_09050 [Cellvibrionales bacterium]